jgi:uroporphyrinogen decarboxylase
MSVNVPLCSEHQRQAEWLVNQMNANGGLAPVDLPRFWADFEVAEKAPLGAHIPQCAGGGLWSGECVYDELGIPEDYRRYETDAAWRLGLHKAYNDKAEKIVGRRGLSEKPEDPSRRWPAHKNLADIFEARNVWHGQSWWLMEAAHNEDELKALLDRVEKRLGNLRSFLLPENWEQEKARLKALGVPGPRYSWQRGPVTFATSVYGPENLLLLVLDNPVLAGRFRDLILRSMLEIRRVLDEEAGYTSETAPKGFGFADDNCCLMTPDMYEFFAYPIVKRVFEVCAPNPGDWRYQHSDSAMGHLLPILGRLNYHGVNFGPTVMCDEIRRHMPQTVIHGQLAPFTYSRNEHVNIVLEFLRDFELTREKRGLRFTTAGSINNGSSMQSMRLIMSAIQHFGRFDR